MLGWLNDIYYKLTALAVPASRPLSLGRYFGVFDWLGPQWKLLITTCCTLAFIYLVVYLIRTQSGLFLKFKEFIQWW
ncbi:hypothetical protein D3C87_1459550 [compost metagenome]